MGAIDANLTDAAEGTALAKRDGVEFASAVDELGGDGEFTGAAIGVGDFFDGHAGTAEVEEAGGGDGAGDGAGASGGEFRGVVDLDQGELAVAGADGEAFGELVIVGGGDTVGGGEG